LLHFSREHLHDLGNDGYGSQDSLIKPLSIPGASNWGASSLNIAGMDS